MDTSNSIAKMDDKEKSFAHGLNFFKLFWIFYIGCFAGVIIETIWCLITNGTLESRTALILFPLNPVYGLGAVLMSICFVRFSGNKNINIFLGCMVVGGAFEYVCSLFQEIVFGTVSWSYSTDSLGIFERTSLLYCTFWGMLGLLWIREIYPYLSNVIEKIPNSIGRNATYIFLIFILIDVIFTSFAVYRQMQRRHGVPAMNTIQEFYDNNFDDNKLKKIYPNMKSVR